MPVQVSEGIHRLTRGVTNFYLIEESGKYTLVDAGTPADWAFFSRSLAELGGKLADLDAVLPTHAHSDHTGFAERARAETRARVWIHRADEDAARTGRAGKNDGKITSYLFRPAFYRTSFSLLRRGAGRMIPIAEVSAFADGEQIDVPGRPRAVHAPGHTPGSAAILFENRRTLLTGDVMATENPLTGRLGPQIRGPRAWPRPCTRPQRPAPRNACTIEPSRTGTSPHSHSHDPPRGDGDWDVPVLDPNSLRTSFCLKVFLCVMPPIRGSAQPGGDAVEHAVQAELETLVPGGRIIRVDAGLHQPGDPREAAGGLEPLAVALTLGPDLLVGQVRLGLLLLALEAYLLCLAHHRAGHEGGDRHEDAHDHAGIVYTCPVEHAQQALQVPHVVRP